MFHSSCDDDMDRKRSKDEAEDNHSEYEDN